MFKAYGFNLRIEDYDLIKRMGKIVTSELIHIFDLKSFDPDVSGEDTLIIYGQHAKNLLSTGCKPLHYLLLKEPIRYDDNLGSSEDKQTAQELLLSLKESIDKIGGKEVQIELENVSFTDESLPSLTSDQVKDLEASLLKQGVLYWEGLTKDGKKIRLTRKPENSTADVNMTFVELYAVRSVMETLQVTSLEVVCGSNSKKSTDK